MFDVKLFGYDKSQVDETLENLNNKINCQQSDINYLRNENIKLQKIIRDYENNSSLER